MDDTKIQIIAKVNDFNHYYQTISRPYIGKHFAILFISCLIAFIVSAVIGEYLIGQAFYDSLPEIIHTFDTALIFFPIFGLVYFFLMQYSPIPLIHIEGKFLHPKEYSINENGIHEISANYNASTSWEGVLRIEEDKNLILIYIDQTDAYVIPRRAFANTVEADAFVRKAKDFHEAAMRNADKKPSFLPRTPTSTRWDE